MHVHMIIKCLVLGVENLNNPGCCSEILFVSRQFQKCLGGAFVKETVQKLLIVIEKRI